MGFTLEFSKGHVHTLTIAKGAAQRPLVEAAAEEPSIEAEDDRHFADMDEDVTRSRRRST